MQVILRARTGGRSAARATSLSLFFFLPERKVGMFVCVLITFSSSSFNVLKNTVCREMFY